MTDEQMDAEQKAFVAPIGAAQGLVRNIYRTLANAPEAAEKFRVWSSFILSPKNPLPSRLREILILRIGFLCRSGYEWTQHHRIGLREGLTAEEIERIKLGPGAGWSDRDAALIRAADELHADQFITDATWAELQSFLSDQQCMAVVFTVAQYTQVSMFLNTLGVQLDPDQSLDPDLKFY
ncbi:MAG: carboxymuconolactone decarboxylase family protein [Phenylobacterium sp.]